MWNKGTKPNKGHSSRSTDAKCVESPTIHLLVLKYFFKMYLYLYLKTSLKYLRHHWQYHIVFNKIFKIFANNCTETARVWHNLKIRCWFRSFFNEPLFLFAYYMYCPIEHWFVHTYCHYSRSCLHHNSFLLLIKNRYWLGLQNNAIIWLITEKTFTASVCTT